MNDYIKDMNKISNGLSGQFDSYKDGLGSEFVNSLVLDEIYDNSKKILNIVGKYSVDLEIEELVTVFLLNRAYEENRNELFSLVTNNLINIFSKALSKTTPYTLAPPSEAKEIDYSELISETSEDVDRDLVEDSIVDSFEDTILIYSKCKEEVISDEDLWICGDKLLNVIMGSLKYTSEGDEVVTFIERFFEKFEYNFDREDMLMFSKSLLRYFKNNYCSGNILLWG